jgi:hypothetical protein
MQSDDITSANKGLAAPPAVAGIQAPQVAIPFKAVKEPESSHFFTPDYFRRDSNAVRDDAAVPGAMAPMPSPVHIFPLQVEEKKMYCKVCSKPIARPLQGPLICPNCDDVLNYSQCPG